MTSTIKTYYKEEHIEIGYDEKNKILINNWKGLLTLDTVKDGCLNMINIFQKKSSCKILNSNINLIGSWAVGVEWTSEVWAPKILESGLKHFAWVHSKENFAKLSADRMVNNIEGKKDEKDEIFVPFEKYNEAYEWLIKK